jgi:NADH-quinone oxidoreductase subunit N
MVYKNLNMPISNSIIGTLDTLLYGPEITMLWTLMLFLCFGVFFVAMKNKEQGRVITANVSGSITDTGQRFKFSSTRYNLAANPMWADWAAVWCLCTLVMLCYSFDSTQIDTNLVISPLQSGVYVRSNYSIGLSKYLFLWTLIVCLFIRNQKGGIEEAFLYLLSAFSMHTMVMSVDLCSLFISLELQTFCIVVLCVIYQNSISSVEAALKYFLLSAFSSALLVLGISLVYCFQGSTDLGTLFSVLAISVANPANALSVAVWFIAIALLWKLAAAPLHMWAADVYQGIPSGVTMFLSTVPKLAVLGFLSSGGAGLTGACLSYDGASIGSGANSTTHFLFCFFAAVSLLIGSYSALGQVSFKRLLAYSSIAQMGFLLMPLITGSVDVILTHITIYIATSLALWGLYMWPSIKPQFIWNWGMLYKTHPEAAFTTALLLTSLAGLPPLAGFLGKLVIFKNCLEIGQNGEGEGVIKNLAPNYTLVLLGLFSTIISTYYYVRFIRVMYGKGIDVSYAITQSAILVTKPSVLIENAFLIGTFNKNGNGEGPFKTRMEALHAYLLTVLVLFLCSLLWYNSPLLMYHQLLAF